MNVYSGQKKRSGQCPNYTWLRLSPSPAEQATYLALDVRPQLSLSAVSTSLWTTSDERIAGSLAKNQLGKPIMSTATWPGTIGIFVRNPVYELIGLAVDSLGTNLWSLVANAKIGTGSSRSKVPHELHPCQDWLYIATCHVALAEGAADDAGVSKGSAEPGPAASLGLYVVGLKFH